MTWWLVLAVMLTLGFVDLFALCLCRIAARADESLCRNSDDL